MVKYDCKAKGGWITAVREELPKRMPSLLYSLAIAELRRGSNPHIGLLTHLFAGSNPAVYPQKVYACGLGRPTGQKTLSNVSESQPFSRGYRRAIPIRLCRETDTATAHARSKDRLSALQAPRSSLPPPDRYERLQNKDHQ